MENIVQGQWLRGPSADLGKEIEQSLRFDSNGYLTRAQNSSGDGLLNDDRTFTFSTWFKHGDMQETQIFGIHPTSGNDNWLLAYTSGSSYETFLGRDASQGWVSYNTVKKYRDPNAWYHLFLTCSSGVLTLWVNGVKGNQTMTQNHSMDRNFYLGCEGGGGAALDGYLAETYFIQGTVMHPVDDGFIRLNDDGVYVPDTPTISSYGTNGWYLKYDPNGVAGGTGDGAGVGADHSGNGNHFTPTGVATADKDIQDTPTQNWATMQPLYPVSGPQYSGAWQSGNLSHGGGTSAWASSGSTIYLPPTGKWYAEVKPINTGSYENWYAGIFSYDSDYGNNQNGYQFSIAHNGLVNEDGTDKQTGVATFADNDIVGIAVDMDTKAIEFFKNGSSVYSGTASSAFDTYKNADAESCGGGLCIQTRSYYYSGQRLAINYGQQSFAHTPPSGYKALQTNNLEEPDIKDGSEHFAAIMAPGSGGFVMYPQPNSPTPTATSAADLSTEQPVVCGSSYTSGLVRQAFVFDTVSEITNSAVDILSQGSGYWGNRTVNAYVSATGAEDSWTQVVTNQSFHGSNENTLTIPAQTASYRYIKLLADTTSNASWKTSSGSAILAHAQAKFGSGLYWIKDRQNTNEHQVIDTVRGTSAVLQCPTTSAGETTYTAPSGISMAWCWKGGGTAVSNSDGTITSNVSANTTAGFSIVTYTGNGSSGATVGHGLSEAPDFIITKERADDFWCFWHKGANTTQGYGYLNYNLSFQRTSTLWTGIGNSTWTYDDNGSVNTNGTNYVSYAWHSVPGYSKFGSFEGNGSTDGAYIYLGFKPAMIMLKNSDDNNHWKWFDSTRTPENRNAMYSLTPRETATDTSNTYGIDFLSNGFKIRDTSGDINSDTMFYCAWAEYPFGGENVPPAPAY
jgi:hypothetical protein